MEIKIQPWKTIWALPMGAAFRVAKESQQEYLIVLCEEPAWAIFNSSHVCCHEESVQFPRSMAFLKHNYFCSSGRCRCPWQGVERDELRGPFQSQTSLGL